MSTLIVSEEQKKASAARDKVSKGENVDWEKKSQEQIGTLIHVWL